MISSIAPHKRANNLDVDLIKLKRSIRFYRRPLIQLINILSIISICFVLYISRAYIWMFIADMKSSYKYLYSSFSDVSYDWFNDIFNKNIAEIEISGINNLSKNEVINAIYYADQHGKIKMYSSLLQMNAILSKMPLVKHVVIKRVLFQRRLIIQVAERNIIGRVIKNGNLFLLDNEGNLVQYNDKNNLFAKAPLLLPSSNNFNQFIPLYRYFSFNNIYNYIEEASMISNRRWDIKFKNGLVVKLPSRNWEQAIDLLITLNAKAKIFSTQNRINYLDLRIPGKIFLK